MATIIWAMIGSKDSRVFLLRFATLGAFVAALWVIQAINWATGYWLNFLFGLIPRQLSGLDGILGMPVLHGSFPHLMSNSVPLIVMGALIAATATRGLLAVNSIIVTAGGALVWIFGSPAIHIGASGLVFGWFGFLVARGIVDRSPITLGCALLVGLVYGSIIWGVMPGQEGVSWEAHLFGALAGALAAVVVPAQVHRPRLNRVDQPDT